MENLQMEIMEAQRKLFRLQAQYNDELTNSNVVNQGIFKNSLAAQQNEYQNANHLTTVGKEHQHLVGSPETNFARSQLQA